MGESKYSYEYHMISIEIMTMCQWSTGRKYFHYSKYICIQKNKPYFIISLNEIIINDIGDNYYLTDFK